MNDGAISNSFQSISGGARTRHVALMTLQRRIHARASATASGLREVVASVRENSCLISGCDLLE